MTRLRTGMFAAAAWAASLCSASAAEWRLEECGCALSLPEEDGWQQLDVATPEAVASVVLGCDEGRRAAALTIVNLPEGSMDIDAFVRGLENGIMESVRQPGGMQDFKKVSGRRLERHGVPAYEFLGAGTTGGTPRSVLNLSMIANGYGYSLVVSVADGDARTDAKAQRVVSGFRFLRPPVPPRLSHGDESLSYRIGKMVGYAIMGVIAVFAIGRFLTRSGKAESHGSEG